MKKYIIERELPGVGKMSAQDFHTMAQKSCDVLNKLGTQIQWVNSYVTGDKVYCVYNAANEGLVMEHAKLGKFPVNRISEVTTIIDPVTAG